MKGFWDNVASNSLPTIKIQFCIRGKLLFIVYNDNEQPLNLSSRCVISWSEPRHSVFHSMFLILITFAICLKLCDNGLKWAEFVERF